ncbi:helix-turn-helix transcriptional regulator [Breznakiella homolactica]|uniref:PAS domain-containing protein n=1 Tax=Breznakiella homolactica TaxID=2798577 RepID=A0A7T7XND3_9SPIR|nr:PAS domain-containing protein [Breznakiella homolactica]QQO09535.1 PAS domain-containing protein [Breznakiella homolactica]
MSKTKSSLSSTDKHILNSYKACLDGLAAYLGGAFEFVLHDLDDLDHSVIKIVNGMHSGRKEGAPITDLALSMLEKITESDGAHFIAYHSKSKYGKPVKAVTIAIFGEQDTVIGLLCINFYMDTSFSTVLQSFLPNNNYTEYVTENFISESDELIVKALEKTKANVESDSSIPVSQKNKEIITLLYHQGIFKLKNSVKLISKDLGITKNTVYMHIRTLESK